MRIASDQGRQRSQTAAMGAAKIRDRSDGGTAEIRDRSDGEGQESLTAAMRGLRDKRRQSSGTAVARDGWRDASEAGRS